MKIAFIGGAGSGKTSSALYLCFKHGFKKYSFADELKNEVMADFGLTKEEVYKFKNVNSRRILQDIGMRRRQEDPSYWIKRVGARIHNDTLEMLDFANLYGIFTEKEVLNLYDPHVVIDDLRFQNEAEWAKGNGFKIVKLVRKGEFKAGGIDKHTKNHISEHEWKSITPDYTIESGNFDELFPKLDKMLIWKAITIPDTIVVPSSAEVKILTPHPGLTFLTVEEFEKQTGNKAKAFGKETKAFKEWLKEKGS